MHDKSFVRAGKMSGCKVADLILRQNTGKLPELTLPQGDEGSFLLLKNCCQELAGEEGDTDLLHYMDNVVHAAAKRYGSGTI